MGNIAAHVCTLGVHTCALGCIATITVRPGHEVGDTVMQYGGVGCTAHSACATKPNGGMRWRTLHCYGGHYTIVLECNAFAGKVRCVAVGAVFVRCGWAWFVRLAELTNPTCRAAHLARACAAVGRGVPMVGGR